MVLDDENPPVTSITEKKPPKQKNTKTNSVVKNRKGNSSTEGKQQKNPKGKKTNNKNEGNSSTEGKQQKNPKGKKTNTNNEDKNNNEDNNSTEGKQQKNPKGKKTNNSNEGTQKKNPKGKSSNKGTVSTPANNSNRNSSTSNRGKEDLTDSESEHSSGMASTSGVSSAGRASKDGSQVNGALLCTFVDVFRTDDFKQQFDHTKFNANAFGDWVQENGTTATLPECVRELYKLCVEKRNRNNAKGKSKTKKKSTDGQSDNSGAGSKEITTLAQVLNIPQIRQILRAALAVHCYGVNDARVYELFYAMFKEKSASPRYLVGTIFLPAILGATRQQKKLMTFVKASKVEALLYFHAVQRHSNQKKNTMGPVGNRIGFAVQKMVKAWKRLLDNIKAEKIDTLNNLILPYLTFNEKTNVFEVLKSRSDGFSPTSMETTLKNSAPVKDVTLINAAAWHRSDELDTALRVVVNMLFTQLHRILDLDYLYSGNDMDVAKWNEMQDFLLPLDVQQLPPVFSTLPDGVCDALLVTKPERPESPPPSQDHVVVDSDDESLEGNGGRKRQATGGDEEGPASKRQKTTATATEVKEEPINLSVKPHRDGRMNKQTSDAFDDIHAHMMKTFTILDDSFVEMCDTARETHGRRMEDNVDLLLTDPPYNIRNEGGKDNANHDVFTEKDMRKLCELCKTVLKPGGHGIIFCSFAQFEKYREILNSFTEETTDYEADSSGHTKTTTTIFTVETSPLVFVRGDGHFSNPSRSPGMHVNMVEICVHFWRKGGDPQAMKRRLDYNTASDYGGTLPSWTNVVTGVPIPSGSEVIYVPMQKEEDAYKYKLRPEQKPLGLLKYLINKFTKAGDLVVDTCAGTFSTMTACVTMDKHRRFIGTDKDPNCASIVEDVMIPIYCNQVQNPQSDISVPNLHLRSCAQTVCSFSNENEVRKRADAWAVAPGLVPMQNFPPHIIQGLCQYFHNFKLYPYRHLSMNRWGINEIQKMNSMDPKALRVIEALKLELVIKPSAIKHPDAGLGVFTTKQVNKGDILGYYYGALVYGNIGVKERLHKRYGTGILSVTSEDFEKWSAKISDYRFVDSNNNSYDGYIAPAPFCVCRYINDPRYRSKDKGKDVKVKRKANVVFRVNEKAKCNRDFEQYTAVTVEALETIGADSELYVNYGDSYIFKAE